MKPELWHIPFSPWSLKARCALRLRNVAVDARVHVPFVTEPYLRLRLRALRGKLTVPIMFTEQGALRDSWDIARYAERVGSGASLLPVAQLAALQHWNASSERLLEAGRVCAMLRVVSSPEAALDAAPRALAPLLGGRGAQLMVGAFNRKYAIRPEGAAAARAVMHGELTALRKALASKSYLLDTFSYADVCMGLALQLVKPLPDSPFGPQSQKAATDPELASEFADLLAYRDALHARHGLLPRG